MHVLCYIDVVFAVFPSLTILFVFFTRLTGNKSLLEIRDDSLVVSSITDDILGCGIPGIES